MAILDFRGNPVDISKLTKEIAAPSVSGVRQVFYEAISTSLTPSKLGQILTAVDQGDATEYLTLAEEMEERDSHYSSVLRTRKLAVSSLKISVEAASEDKRDVEIADAVTKLTKSEHFRELIADQLDALGKGYSVSEIMWDKSGSQWLPKNYIHRDPRFFIFDRFTGQELRLRDDEDLKTNKDKANGLPLDPYKYVVHTPRIKTGMPIRGGLARLVCVAFMCKSYTLKDWMTFAEVFGMPLRVGKYGASATDVQKAALLNAVSQIGTDAAAIIPDSMLIEFQASTSSVGGDKLFAGLADWLDRQVSKGVLGQTTSTDAASTGLGSGVADSQSEVRSDICDDDAFKLAATLRRDLIRPFVDLNWGPPKTDYPTITLGVEESEDLEMLSRAITPFIDRGMRVGVSAIRDKFGVEEPAEDEEVLKPVGGGGLPPISADIAAPDVSAPKDPKASDAQAVDPRTALNGAQVTALLEIVQAVAAGSLPRSSGVQMIVASFPISLLDAEKLMGDVGKGFKPASPEPAPSAPPFAPHPKAPPLAPPPAIPPKQKAREEAQATLIARVIDGIELTADQRALLGLAAVKLNDEIDTLADEALDDWRPVMDPILDPILAMAENATSLEGLMKDLKNASPNSSALVQAVAKLTMKARGLGDVGK